MSECLKYPVFGWLLNPITTIHEVCYLACQNHARMLVSMLITSLLSRIPQSITHPSLTVSLMLLLLRNIRLRAPLRRLPIIMLHLILILPRPIPRQPRDRTTHRSPNPILHPMSIITQLPVRLLALALGVLLLPFALETLGTDQVANGLFCAADSLVVGASGAVWVVG